jgi:hypothetical protein
MVASEAKRRLWGKGGYANLGLLRRSAPRNDERAGLHSSVGAEPVSAREMNSGDAPGEHIRREGVDSPTLFVALTEMAMLRRVHVVVVWQ